MDVDFSALFSGFCLRGSCLWAGGDIADEEGIAADVPGDGAVAVNAAGRAYTTVVPGQTTMPPGEHPVKTLIATAFPVEYALPVMVSAALMSRLILIPVRRFLTGQGCGVNARMRTAEATGIWAMAVAAMLFCLAQAPFTERLHALLMSGFLLQLGVCDAASGWLPRQMTVAFLVAGVLASGITEPPVVILVHAAVTVLISAFLMAEAAVVFSGHATTKPPSAGCPVPEGYRRVAEEYGVPAEALYSVSLAESSRRLPQGERPWPWTLNVAGKGYRYATREEAYQALLGFMRHHPLRRIDVGILILRVAVMMRHSTNKVLYRLLSFSLLLCIRQH